MPTAGRVEHSELAKQACMARSHAGIAERALARPNKGMKLTRLSAAPGGIGGAASCALGQEGRTALQLIPGVGRTWRSEA